MSEGRTVEILSTLGIGEFKYDFGELSALWFNLIIKKIRWTTNYL